MKTIIENKEIIYMKEKSKFIGIIYKVQTREDITKKLNELKDQYIDATHICYAYILPNHKKCSDDGEPSGTAGHPILDILEKNNLFFILAVVIRYFGGIKLGSNGLIRAYSNTIKEALIDNIKELEEALLIKIDEDYTNLEKITYLLKDEQIINKEFTNRIVIYAIIRKKVLNNFSSFNYQILEEKVI